MKNTTNTEQKITRMNNIFSLIVLLTMFSIIESLAQQQTLEFTTSSATAVSTVTTTPKVFTFYRNSDNPSGTTFTSTTNTVTFSISNQFYTSIEGNPSVPGLFRGGVVSGSTNIVPNDFDTRQLGEVGSASSANFSSSPQNIGSGISTTENYSAFFLASTDALINSNGTNKIPITTDNVQYADLTITFNTPVTNPILHIAGLGGANSISDNNVLGFSSTLSLPVGSPYSLTKLSGSTFFSVASNKISNNATFYGHSTNGTTGSGSGFSWGHTGYAASGSVQINGSNITTVTFRVAMDSDGGTGTVNWSTTGEVAGDAWLMSVSIPVYTISGTIFNDINGSTNGVDGTGTDIADALQVNLLDNSGKVVATLPVQTNGTYTFTNINPGTYSVQVNQTAGTVGNAAPSQLLPAGWVNTGDEIGATQGSSVNTGTGESFTIASSNITEVNFGIQQPPIAVNDASLNNVLGTNVTVNPLTGDSDPSAGGSLVPASISMVPPVGATSIITDGQGDIVGFTVPNQGVWTVDQATGAVTFNPDATFLGDPTPISYTVDDNAGFASNPATITITYNDPVTISGTIFNDIDGSTNGVDGTGTDIADALQVNLLDNSGKVMATLPVQTNGTYSFPNIVPGAYSVQVNQTAGTVGSAAPAQLLPAGWVNTGDEIGATQGTSPNTGTGEAFVVGSSNVTNVNFGVELAPVAVADNSTGNVPGTVTVNVLANDSDTGGSLVTTTVSLVAPTGSTINNTDPNGDVLSVTVPGQGTWTVNAGSGAITFTPLTGFTGNPTPISYNVEDNAAVTSNNATVTITYLGQPTANNDSSTGNVPGANVTLNILSNDLRGGGTAATAATTSVTLTTIGLPGGSSVSGNVLTVAGQGTWTYDPATGNLTFDPNSGFTSDPAVITYTLTETLTGLTDTATVTVGVTEVPPTANNDSSTGNGPGTNVTVNILSNDLLSDGTAATTATTSVTLTTTGLTGGSTVSGNVLTVPGQGTWTYDPATGNLTFDPNPGFTSDPAVITYTLTETLTGLTDTATVTVGVTEVPPTANNDSKTGNAPGTNVTVNILTNDLLSDGTAATAATTSVTLTTTGLPGGSSVSGNVLTVAGQGTWTYDPATGNLTFDPNSGFTSDPAVITYTLTETLTGLTDTATVTVGVTEVPPTANNDSSTGNGPGTNVTVNILSNDLLSDGTAATTATTSVTLTTAGLPAGSTLSGNVLTVAGQGTWTYDPATGNLTFDPNPGFITDPTVITYTLTETLTGLTDPATVTVGYWPCLVDIGGTIYLDVTGSKDGVNGSEVNGTAIGSPSATEKLYVSLFDANGTTKIDVKPVDANGKYLFTNIPAGTYKLILGTSIEGSAQKQLPSGYYTVSEGGPISDGTSAFPGIPVGRAVGDGSEDGTTKIAVSCSGITYDVARIMVVANPEFLQNDFGISTQNPLPVTLIGFEISKLEQRVNLTWKTTNEKDFSHFEIERSFDSKSFTWVVSVPASKSGSYNHLDTTPLKGISYYRLKMVDLDGSFAYSRIKSIYFDSPLSLSLSPNPATNIINLRIDDISSWSEIKSVRLYDLNGRMVYSASGLINGEINVSNLTAGAYAVAVTYNKGTVRSSKIVIVR